jgi:quinol monooxygenase YgiN
MFTTLAKVRIADAQRFLEVFSTLGQAKRRAHGSLGAQAFMVPDVPGTAVVLIDWTDRASFDAFRTDPAVPPTMRSGGALEPPQFTVLERRGRYEA